MTHRRDLERHRHSLAEIRGIMNSMKTLAYMETRKLARFLESQQAAVQSIEEVATDLLSFYSDILPAITEVPCTYLLIGTERGFCGDFNHALAKQLESTLQENAIEKPALIIIGRKLQALFEKDKHLVSSLSGASVTEEITDLLSQIVEQLMQLQEKHCGLTLHCLYHNGQDDIVIKKLLPPFQDIPSKRPSYAHPPQLTMSPRQLLSEITEQYLFAALHEILYTSLAAENHARINHLERAIKHLDEESETLARQCNILRQEEIIEEIEVILLSTASTDDWQTDLK